MFYAIMTLVLRLAIGVLVVAVVLYFVIRDINNDKLSQSEVERLKQEAQREENS